MVSSWCILNVSTKTSNQQQYIIGDIPLEATSESFVVFDICIKSWWVLLLLRKHIGVSIETSSCEEEIDRSLKIKICSEEHLLCL